MPLREPRNWRLCRLAYLSARLHRTLPTLPLLPRVLLALWVPQALLGQLDLQDLLGQPGRLALPEALDRRVSPAAAVIPALRGRLAPLVLPVVLALRVMLALLALTALMARLGRPDPKAIRAD